MDNFKAVLTEIDSNDCQLSHVIADNPKRAFVRNSLSHGAKYACEYCFAQGLPLSKTPEILQKLDILEKQKRTIISGQQQDKEKHLQQINQTINKLSKSTQIVWPKACNGEPRTSQIITEIVQELNDSNNLKDIKGIVGKSPLLDFQTFNYVHGIPTKYLHSICIGLVKRLLELCFNVGDLHTRITTSKLATINKFNTAMASIKVPREFSRRCRKLDFSVLKAQEFRNILIFYFAIITESFQPQAKERKLWLLLAFSVRAAIIPEPEFDNHLLALMNQSMQSFYSLYEALFGAKNCTYTVHIVANHLSDMRIHGPLTQTSAFDYESFLRRIAQIIRPGHPKPPKTNFSKCHVKTLPSTPYM